MSKRKVSVEDKTYIFDLLKYAGPLMYSKRRLFGKHCNSP